MSKDKRRNYGSGSVFQRCELQAGCPPLVPGLPDPKTGKPTMVRPVHQPCRGRWVANIEAGWTRRGTRRRITVYGKTEAEAKQKLRDKQRKINTEGLPTADPATAKKTTVKSYAEAWLERIVTEVRPGSYNADRGAVTNWIIPTIGQKRFENLTPGDIRAVAKAQRDAGKSTSTALRTHATLTKLLKAALLDGHTVPARVLQVERPTPAKSDRDAMEVGDALAVLEQASKLEHGSRWVAALLQGMRQGECLGLTWPLVDLDAEIPTFDISWQLQPLPYRDKKDRSKGFRVPDGFDARQLEGRLHLVRPKSEQSQRIIPLVPWMVSALRAWREVAPPSPHRLVWPRADGGPASAAQDLEEWKALQCEAGVGHPAGRWYGTHEARHTTATLLLEAGIDPEVIKAILGHSSIVTSRLYMHVNHTLTQQAMEKVATRLQLT
jgi:integrase